MTTAQKISTDILRDMKVGDTIEVPWSRFAEVLSAQSLCYRMKRLYGCRFITKTDEEKKTLTVTREL